MTAEKYIAQVKKLDVIILNKYKERKRWEEIADSLGGFSVSDRVQTTKNPHRGTDAVDEYLDIDREIEVLKQERQAIINTIQRLPFIEYDILYKLFVEEKEYTLKEIAYEYSKSYEWAKARKKKALKHLQQIIDKKG